MKKKKIISLVLALVLVLVTAIPVSAESGYCFVYDNKSYYVSKLGEDELGGKTIAEIKQALKNSSYFLKNSENEDIVGLSNINNPILYCNGKQLVDVNVNATLANLGIKVGDTIEVYDYAQYVNVRFEGKEYAVSLEGVSNVNDLKKAIENCENAPIASNQILYDKSGNLLLDSDSVTTGMTVMLYKKESGTITSVDDGYNDYKLPVTATYESGDGAPATYCVDVSWGTMQFTYNAPKKVWDPIGHTEEDDGVGTFSCVEGTNQITVANHSNVKVEVKFEFNADSAYGLITGVFTGKQSKVTGNDSSSNNTAEWSNVNSDLTSAGVTLAAGTVDQSDNQIVTDVMVATLDLSGELGGITDGDTRVIGTVTVTIGSATGQ